MSGSSWFDTGFEAVGNTVEKNDAARDAGFGPSRYWMPPDTEKKLVFIDDVPVAVYEHNPKLNGSFRNWITCDNDVCCEELGADSRYYVGFLTVVDMDKWTDKKGREHQFELRLYPAKSKTLKKLKRRQEKAGISLKVVDVVREDVKSPNVGDSFEFGRDADAEKLFEVALYNGTPLTKLWVEAAADAYKMEALKKVFQLEFNADGDLVEKVVPFNYYEVLKPKGPEAIKSFLGAGGSGGGKGSDSGPKDFPEDLIPF